MDSEANKAVFEGNTYAENYRRGRPRHPETLANAMIDFLRIKVLFCVLTSHVLAALL